MAEQIETRLPRWVVAIVTVTALLAVASAPAHSAFEQVVPPPAQPEAEVVPVFSFWNGVLVWNEREGGADDGRYFLAAMRDGRRFRLPIAPRTVPFDVDVGPDEQMRPVVAYSRCQQEPTREFVEDNFGLRVFSEPYPAWTAGRGCDVYRFDLQTGHSRKFEGASTNQASEVLPSVWRDQVAFARVYEQRAGARGRLPYLYVRATSNASTVRSNRQPGGTRGHNGLPGPTRLDLYGRRLSFVWNFSTRPEVIEGFTRLRMDTVDGGHRLLSSARFRGAERASFLGPQGSRGRIFYGFQRILEREGSDDPPPASLTSLLLRYRIATGDKALSDVDGILIDTGRDLGVNYISRADRFDGFRPGPILRDASVEYRD